jgi:hypothetical protein
MIVMVEGETQQDDPYFYQRWFGNRATRISFFAQNGWQQVERSVRELRDELPDRSIYGIIDRDFAPQDLLEAQYRTDPSDGIFRSTYYTLENYLFEPVVWHRVLLALHRHAPPEGWRDQADIAERIRECVREFLPVAAYNRVIRRENMRCHQTLDGRPDKTHVRQMQGFDPEELSRWGQGRQCGEDLGQRYLAELRALEQLPIEELHCWIHGKYLLENVWLPRIPKGGINQKHLVSLYIDQCATPPADLVRLIDRIMEVGGQR